MNPIQQERHEIAMGCRGSLPAAVESSRAGEDQAAAPWEAPVKPQAAMVDCGADGCALEA